MKFFLSLLFAFCIGLVCAPVSYAVEPTITITEFLPNPVDDEALGEWIELHNSSGFSVTLDGWVLSDVYGTIKHFSLTGKQIEAGGYLLVYRSESQITMNNDTELLMLTAPDGNMYSTAVVSNPLEGQSYTYIEGSWILGEPTPGGPYIPQATPEPSPIPSPSPSPTLAPSPSPLPVLQNIQLSEFLACGSQSEWVELYNPNPAYVSLDDWKLQDSTSQSKSLEGLRIASQGYLAKEWSGYFLNNGGDEIRLFHGDELVESFTYETCSADSTWAKHDGVWELTSTITKDKENEFSGVVVVSPSPAPIVIEQRALAGTTTPSATIVPEYSRQDYFTLPVLHETKLQEHVSVSNPPSKKSLPKPPTEEIPPPFSWFISSGCWLLTAASLLAKNATIPYAFTAS